MIAPLCRSGKYIIPLSSDIPKPFYELTKSKAKILRIFDIDIGPYKRGQYGSRKKNGAFELRYREDTVKQRIEEVKCDISRLRLQKAYSYLLNS